MPALIMPEQMEVETRGEGWVIWRMVNHRATQEPVLLLRRWLVSPGARTPEVEHTTAQERFFYVVRGHGTLLVNGSPYPIEEESVLWAEPGDRFAFAAGDTGLEVLEALSPEFPSDGGRE